MPQLTAFPYLPEGDAGDAVDRLIKVCRGIPADGESYRALRDRLREHRLWHKERLAGLLAFFKLPGGDQLTPSPLIAEIASADSAGARLLIAERMWQANPILFKAVVDHLGHQVAPPGELYKFVDSFAYRGTPIPRQDLIAWTQLAKGVGVLRRVGVAIGLGELAASFADRMRDLDIDEYLAEDEDEPAPAAVSFGRGAVASESAEAATPAAPEAVVTDLASAAIRQTAAGLGSPLGQRPPVPLASVAAAGPFTDELLVETTARLEAWWDDGGGSGAAPASADFGIDSERWMEGSEEALYRLAIAAAFAFRLPGDSASVQAAFRALEQARVFDDLYYGTAPDVLPAGVDSRALMLASLVARRCAEAPELATSIEKQTSAAEAFALLDSALGRGLLELELFWIMRALGEVGAARWDDLADYTALPTRSVRDTLFRLGYLDTPYASDLTGLARAAAAARRAAGSAAPADAVLGAFAVAAGCAYDCDQRRTCDFACRERLS